MSYTEVSKDSWLGFGNACNEKFLLKSEFLAHAREPKHGRSFVKHQITKSHTIKTKITSHPISSQPFFRVR